MEGVFPRNKRVNKEVETLRYKEQKNHHRREGKDFSG